MQFNKDIQRISPWGKNNKPWSIRSEQLDSTAENDTEATADHIFSSNQQRCNAAKRCKAHPRTGKQCLSHARHERALVLRSAPAEPETSGSSGDFRQSDNAEGKATECDLQLKLETSGVAQACGGKTKGNLATFGREMLQINRKLFSTATGRGQEVTALLSTERDRSDTSMGFKTGKD